MFLDVKSIRREPTPITGSMSRQFFLSSFCHKYVCTNSNLFPHCLTNYVRATTRRNSQIWGRMLWPSKTFWRDISITISSAEGQIANRDGPWLTLTTWSSSPQRSSLVEKKKTLIRLLFYFTSNTVLKFFSSISELRASNAPCNQLASSNSQILF